MDHFHSAGDVAIQEANNASSQSHAGMMMMMYFHGGYNEVILFDFWRINTVGGLIGSMVACLVLAVIYEGLKFARESLVLRTHFQAGSSRVRQQQQAEENEEPATFDEGSTSSLAPHEEQQQQVQQRRSVIRTIETNLFSRAHLALTALHLLQVSLAYMLMLAVMGFNSYIFGAVVTGAALGHFLFGWRKTLLLEQPEHCH